MFEQYLVRFQKNRFRTSDDTWIHYYTPEKKQQSKWLNMLILHHQKMIINLTGKSMASVFWDAKGILLVDYLSTSQTITAGYYANLLDQLPQKYEEKNQV